MHRSDLNVARDDKRGDLPRLTNGEGRLLTQFVLPVHRMVRHIETTRSWTGLGLCYPPSRLLKPSADFAEVRMFALDAANGRSVRFLPFVSNLAVAAFEHERPTAGLRIRQSECPLSMAGR
jgi:hypothetical protein